MNNRILNAAEFRQKQDMWRTALCLHKTDIDRALPSKVLRVALALQHYERATGESQGTCYPRATSIATRAGIRGKATTQKAEVSRALKILQEIGLVKKLYDGVKGYDHAPEGVPATWELTLPDHMRAEIEALFPPRDDRKNIDPSGDSTQHPLGDTTQRVKGDTAQRVKGEGTQYTTSEPTFEATSETNLGGANGVRSRESGQDYQPGDTFTDWAAPEEPTDYEAYLAETGYPF